MKNPHEKEEFYLRKLLKETKLSEIMKQPVICLHYKDHFSIVHEKMETHSTRHLPVVDDVKKVVGIITQRDLYRVHSPRKLLEGGYYYDKEALDSFILSEVMTKNPFTLTPDHSAGDALRAMADFKYGCIPVVNKYHEPVGMITQNDVLKIAARILDQDSKK